jgi:excisionase family DNA binding protein
MVSDITELVVSTNEAAMSSVQVQTVLIGKIFLTVEEAAQRLGVTVGWIYERTRRKAIPHRKLGKFVRFTEEDLRAIVEAAAKGTMQ